jgi:hypothetical protein
MGTPYQSLFNCTHFRTRGTGLLGQFFNPPGRLLFPTFYYLSLSSGGFGRLAGGTIPFSRK